MRSLIISDIHANLTALEAVLADAGSYDRVLCLGDVVGYGPDPDTCIERIRELPNLSCIKGNHDAAILGEIDVRAFNFEARASLVWLENALHPENKVWLGSLPESLTIDNFKLAHGSPRSPIWEYVMDVATAWANFSAFETPFCLVGHTHLPGVYQQDESSPNSVYLQLIEPDRPFWVNQKAIINPGSVGQPRDHDPRAAYLIHDDADDRWDFRRVAYDISQVQERIRAAGLPERHAQRLEGGW